MEGARALLDRRALPDVHERHRLDPHPELVYGTSIEELTRLGVNQIRLDSVTVAAAAPFYSGRIVGGVLSERADRLYQSWASRRSE